MLKYPPEEIQEQIEQHWQNLLLIRSLTPYLKFSLIGYKSWHTAHLYKKEGYSATVWLDQPLTQEKIETINFASNSINQSFVVRLWAYLEYCGVYEQIDHSLKGHDEIDILRRLRNHFAHKSGDYNPDNKKQRKTYNRMIEVFNLDLQRYPESNRLFPVSIDEVLKPLVEGCKRYVKALETEE